jgi:hypothetical protein
MITRSIRGAPAAIVTLSLAAALLVPAGQAFADSGVEDGAEDGWKKVLQFARCAVHVFRAVTPADWSIAFLDCGRLMMEEPTLPGGQP